MIDLLQTVVMVGGGLLALLLVLLAIPKTRFLATVLELTGWAGAAAGAVAVASPIDLVPDVVPVLGQADDLLYGVIALLCAVLAYTQRRGRLRQRAGAEYRQLKLPFKE